MQQIVKELRSAIEMQDAIQGTLVPLGSKDETSTDDATTVQASHVTIQAPHADVPAAPSPAPVAPQNPSLTQDTMPETDLFGKETDPVVNSRSPYERVGDLIPSDSPLHAMNSLEDVERYVKDTVLIPLDAERINPVFGVGHPDSNLLVIGEAPGADEDKQGEPFVGRAGQLLTKILSAINFEREDIYIANILKSRPPDNREPRPEEVAAHIPILYKQIMLIKPKIILCVGRTAGNRLLNKTGSLASLRGKFNDFHGIPVMVTYHPAALLRNPNWKRPTWEDVQLLRAHYDELVG